MHDAASVAGGGDVKEDEFVGTLGVVGFGGFDGVAGVTKFNELHAFDDTAVLNVETGNDAAGEHEG